MAAAAAALASTSAVSSEPRPNLSRAAATTNDTMAAVATLTNKLQAYLTSVAGASDAQRDSRVLGAGTTGTLLVAATGATVQAGSAIVAAAAELPSFPQLEQAFGDGRVSSQHVSVILQTTKGLGNREDVVNTAVGLAAATDPRETRHVLQVIADAESEDHAHLSHMDQRAVQRRPRFRGPEGPRGSGVTTLTAWFMNLRR